MTEALPEQIELDKKNRLLERLKDRLADNEEAMVDLRGGLERFEAKYSMEVGRLYAEQDEIDALIAEEELKLVPDDEEIKKKVEELRRIAEESAARAKAAEESGQEKWEPTAAAKKAYHDLARIIHPDLALDAAEKERRHGLMAELNQAYSTGDQFKLDRLARDLKIGPEAIKGDTVADRLIRAIRQISQITKRLKELKEEKTEKESSELFELSQKVSAELEHGRDLLSHMAARARTHIQKTKRRLLHLQEVNRSAEEYVKEKFGMDISDFRDNAGNN